MYTRTALIRGSTIIIINNKGLIKLSYTCEYIHPAVAVYTANLQSIPEQNSKLPDHAPNRNSFLFRISKTSDETNTRKSLCDNEEQAIVSCIINVCMQKESIVETFIHAEHIKMYTTDDNNIIICMDSVNSKISANW